MTKYRKKPVIIEAMQFNGTNAYDIKQFVGDSFTYYINDCAWQVGKGIPHIVNPTIHTLEGDMEVSKGDYIIKGVNGEFYPCKPDIFDKTYEKVEDE